MWGLTRWLVIASHPHFVKRHLRCSSLLPPLPQCSDSVPPYVAVMFISAHITSPCPPLYRSDASLYCDDVDIRFSKTMNSCKVLQIRYASVERLLERLTDLRFLSIDFLNTFLHSYRVFTDAVVVLDKLISIYKKPITAIPARYMRAFCHHHLQESLNSDMMV